MISKVQKLDFSALDISADLTISCAAVKLIVKAEGKSIYIRFSSFQSAFSIFKLLQSKSSSTDFLTMANRTLKLAEYTVFVQNRHFAILGAKANRFLLYSFRGLLKSVNFIR